MKEYILGALLLAVMGFSPLSGHAAEKHSCMQMVQIQDASRKPNQKTDLSQLEDHVAGAIQDRWHPAKTYEPYACDFTFTVKPNGEIANVALVKDYCSKTAPVPACEESLKDKSKIRDIPSWVKSDINMRIRFFATTVAVYNGAPGTK